VAIALLDVVATLDYHAGKVGLPSAARLTLLFLPRNPSLFAHRDVCHGSSVTLTHCQLASITKVLAAVIRVSLIKHCDKIPIEVSRVSRIATLASAILLLLEMCYALFTLADLSAMKPDRQICRTCRGQKFLVASAFRSNFVADKSASVYSALVV